MKGDDASGAGEWLNGFLSIERRVIWFFHPSTRSL
jgi:hypothetical protein